MNMKVIVIFLFLFINSSLISQNFQLINGVYRSENTIVLDNELQAEQRTERFNFWLSKQTGVSEINQSASACSCRMLIIQGESEVELLFSYSSTSTQFSIIITECKYKIGGVLNSIESISDETLKTSLIDLINNKIIWFNKSLNSEFSEA